ncbi:acyl-CoA dehydrogenase [Rhodococcus oxybenzonivorans]|uniref:Acyl-CoA dehydrogenase n=1 Tax=Rhodococcus oxybenzonivorans TaxID=1990687 RepID=A0A2S2BQH6_9NOCA|nr:acyl-CoA dehydrogenase [Rhodococcus oxybenzonivorans]AWK70839.1 acyl-CoA dehydrogenase [Rhodococcus oxybenzonivorans]
MTIATTEEQRAAAGSIQAWARSTDPLVTVRQGPADSWRTSWSSFASLGIFSVAVPDAVGGSGAEIVDLAAMIEQAATELVPGPVLPTALAALVVGRSSGAAAKTWSENLADGKIPCAVALGSPPVNATLADDGGLVITGDAGFAIGADSGMSVLLAADPGDGVVWCLVDGESAGLEVAPADTIDKSRPLARIRCTGVAVAPDRVITGLREGLVRDLAATLAAAEASGVARWCLRTAVDYAKIREQFGKPIGSFQAIKHLCAEMLCRVEASSAAAWDAAVAAEGAWDADGGELPIAASVAAAVTLDAAVETAKDCIQVLGGIGFTWEHDAHFYLRRSTSLRQLLGGSTRWRARVAELTRGGARRHLSLDLSELADERARIRAEVTELVALPDSERRAALAESGYLAPHWPEPYGRGARAAEQILIEQELAAVGVTRPDLVIGWWAVPTILEHGSPEQIERFAMPTLRGDIIWCQLFSEPGAGSDLAALRTSAVKVDGGWTLSGQKVWTSRAHEADWAICLARTDRDAPKHKGITYFLVDMTSPGITISPLREITGDALFNEVYLEDVFVPDDLVVGNLGDGWKLARTTLANERVAMGGGSSLGAAMEELLTLAGEGDPVTDDRLGRLIAGALVGSVLELRTTLRQLDGQDPGAESSVRKLVGVRQRQEVAEFAMELGGVDGWVESPLSREFLNTRCLSIAGGTTQILLTVAAERILGLPRS